MEGYPAKDNADDRKDESDDGQCSSDDSSDHVEEEDDNCISAQNDSNINTDNLSNQGTTAALSTGNINAQMSSFFEQDYVQTEITVQMNLSDKLVATIRMPLGSLSEKFRPLFQRNLFCIDETSSIDPEEDDISYLITPYIYTEFSSDDEIILFEEEWLFIEEEEIVSSEPLCCTYKACRENMFENCPFFNPDDASSDYDDSSNEDDSSNVDCSFGNSTVEYSRSNSATDAYFAVMPQIYIFNGEIFDLPPDYFDCIDFDMDIIDLDAENIDTISHGEDSEAEYFQPRLIQRDYVSPRRHNHRRRISDENDNESSLEEDRVENVPSTPRSRPRDTSGSSTHTGRRMNVRRLFVDDENIDATAVDDHAAQQTSGIVRYPSHCEDSSATGETFLQ